ncbi:unnamed protein product [Brachionus calyciflorus]|uniref:Uncharacterized protein n=1 Tax=Brachionus calyciflorus TaxID=104777 RepID=A0A814PVX9_9BILA|nr:unnamed protein product [Brachionus calyciflorus]
MAFAYNTAVHNTTGVTPFEVVYGRRPKLPVDLMFPCPGLDVNLDVESYAQKIRTDLLKCYETVARNSDSKVSKFKFYADRNVRSCVPAQAIQEKKCLQKVKSQVEGTLYDYRSENNYQIKPDSGGKKQLVHANRLKKCFRPAVNIRYHSCVEDSEIVPNEKSDGIQFGKDLDVTVADKAEPVKQMQIGFEPEPGIEDEPIDINLGIDVCGSESAEVESSVENGEVDADFEFNYYLEKQIESAQRADLLAGEEASQRRSQRNRRGPDRLTYF